MSSEAVILFLRMKNARYRPEKQEAFDRICLPEYSHLYLAIDEELTAVICIEDPLREEAGGYGAVC